MNPVFAGHLEVKKHQVDWKNGSGFLSILFLDSVLDDLTCHLDCLFSVLGEDTFVELAEVLELLLDDLHVDHLILSYKDFLFKFMGIMRRLIAV